MRALSDKNESPPATIVDEIRAIDDSAAIPAFEAVTLNNDFATGVKATGPGPERLSLAFVKALDKMRDEPATNSLWDLVFGRYPGWWQGGDAPSPLRSGDEWRSELAIAGFAELGTAAVLQGPRADAVDGVGEQSLAAAGLSLDQDRRQPALVRLTAEEAADLLLDGQDGGTAADQLWQRVHAGVS